MHKAEQEGGVDSAMHLSHSDALDQHHQTFLSLHCLKNMDCKGTAALLVVFSQYWVAICNLPAVDGSQSKQFVFKEKLHGSRDSMCG